MTISLVRTRPARPDDLDAVLALHARCSPRTLERRFHAPLAQVSPRLAAELLAPRRGWSVVGEQCGQIVGLGCVAAVSHTRLEVGLLVEDAYQGSGVGTRLLRDLAGQAAARGFDGLVCVAHPDNDPVLATVRRAGLDGVATLVDGLMEIVVPLPAAGHDLRRPA